ncbi:L-idonate 5-dehydrogenase (plasmid) [Paracoccus liaowanqingii]|uniref:L-idonate 5-dehydrogenase n=1 Tax=Paracoccus liaowanqingii TaxID=2560053 RepID=A0A4Y5SSQ6_9RHOB|nr:L-idonate 5-dehydrogenase [Paracoccus liaowanqingii]QDA35835.1 L-idonate 5-dehydrogenase [Paracoccus liaowanqingii]
MIAITISPPHDLRVETLDIPAAPGPGEVAVTVSHGGICGSDLHYYRHGGFGTVRVRQTMALGHEVSGTIAAVGPGVEGLAPGDPVAVNPSRPCGRCAWCDAGKPNLCADMRFSGSAMRDPHEQGLFRSVLTVPAAQAVRLPAGTDLAQAALTEPLAVCLHAIGQAGDITGQTVLISGAGPIGCLAVAVARHAGAGRILVTDIAPDRLDLARRMGADECLDLTAGTHVLTPWQADRGKVDLAVECSGAEAALHAACAALRPAGTLVALGLGAEPALPMSLVVTKELRLLGSFRFDAEFAQAAQLIAGGQIDVTPLVTAVFPAARAAEAFAAAAGGGAMKVQLDFANTDFT